MKCHSFDVFPTQVKLCMTMRINSFFHNFHVFETTVFDWSQMLCLKWIYSLCFGVYNFLYLVPTNITISTVQPLGYC